MTVLVSFPRSFAELDVFSPFIIKYTLKVCSGRIGRGCCLIEQNGSISNMAFVWVAVDGSLSIPMPYQYL